MGTKTYLLYCLTLLTAALVYVGYAALAVVSAGIGWVPAVSWLASLLHFGVSSWLFLWVGKTGRLLAVLTAAAVGLWPAVALLQLPLTHATGDLVYLLPLLLGGLTSYWHLRALRQPAAVPGRVPRLILSIIPLSLLLYVGYFLVAGGGRS